MVLNDTAIVSNCQCKTYTASTSWMFYPRKNIPQSRWDLRLTDFQFSNIYDISSVPIEVFGPTLSISCLQRKTAGRSRYKEDEANRDTPLCHSSTKADCKRKIPLNYFTISLLQIENNYYILITFFNRKIIYSTNCVWL